MDKKFPYTSLFESNVSYGGLFSECPFYSQASLEGLRALIPNYEVDLTRNIDLLAFASNACSAGMANKNDDILEPEAAIETLSLWKQKLINLEHDRKKVVGHLLTSSISSYNDSILISPQDALSMREPFNVSVGGVIYRIVDRELAETLESSSNPDSPLYKSLSLSFELGFPQYSLAIGSQNYFDAEIIRDQKHVNELKGNLRIYGGNGKTKSGESIYRLIEKDHLPLAVAITRKPAARMPYGTITNDSPSQPNRKTTISLSFEDNFNKNKKTSVNPDKPKNMENLEKFLLELKASVEKSSLEKTLKEETFANLQTSFSDQIKKASEEYVAKLGEAKAAKESAEKQLSDIKATQEAQAAELAATKAKLAELETKATAEAAANLFSARMAEMDAEYDLTDEDREVLAADIKNLDETEAAFNFFKKKSETLMKDKNKKAKESKEKETKAAIEEAVAKRLAEIAKASTKKGLTDKELAEKALEEAKASEKSVKLPNSNQSQSDQVSLKEKFAAAFTKENITVTL